MQDSYNRTIDYLRISITDKCNLKCVYCKPKASLKHFSGSEVLTSEEIIRLVRIAHKYGVKKVRLTGGEPLMRKDVVQLISSIKRIGIPDLSLTTNGIMLADLAEDLKKAGLDRVNISLDSMNAERFKTITNGGDLDRVLKALDAAEKNGFSPVKINIVPIRGFNDDEIISFASLTLSKDYHIRFIEFMPVGCNEIWEKGKCISAAEVIERISTLGELTHLEFKGKGPSRNYQLKGARGIIGVISPITDHFCKFCNRLRLTADGKIRPCLFSNVEIDVRTPMKNGATDEEIDKLFCHAIEVKPERHLLDKDTNSSKFLQAMSKIGG
ncbi:MAG: GTP 3',8-cyclase MoaA [Nitrospiraceae bacterium]|nr:MAG: GTP 3',8-cyclase MoaA [Nitrospiraceae bacterium]